MKKICKKIFIIIIILEIIASYLPAINYKVLADDETESDIKDIDSDNGKTEIQFGNQTIKEYFIQNCDFDEDKIITEADMLQVENVELNNLSSGEIDFTGLEYAKNLKSLKIENPGIKILNPNNVEVFKSFKKLEKLSLRLDYNSTQDISSLLTGLTSLKTLDIWYADLSKLDFKNFGQLEELRMGGVRLNNIAQISELSGLAKLTIYNYTGLTDFENLPISNLQELTLGNADISKINLSSNNKITNLCLNNCKANDLSFLQNKTKLESLSLDDNNIEDISVLSTLKNLNNLSLNNNKIKNISVLENLNKLENLNLRNNYITDISSIKNLNCLHYVDLSQNPINPLQTENAETLQTLENQQTYISIDDVDQSEPINFKDKNLEQKIIEAGYDRDKNGIITINEMGQIYYLLINDYQKPLTDISELQYAINLTNLSVNLNTKDISVLSNLTKLNHLSITSSKENKVDNISALANLTNLQYLSFGETDIKDISPLGNLTNLIDFAVYSNSNDKNENGIKDISVIANFTKLEYLHISGQSFSDISALENLTDLKSIGLNNNKISNISAIKKLENLESVYLSSNYIEDISPILEWKCANKVTSLQLNSNRITDITLLPNIMTKLTNITDFWLQNNSFEDISVIRQLKNLNNFSSLKFGELQYTIDLGKIERNSNRQINLPNTFSQVEEIFDDLEWNTYIYDADDWMNNSNNNIVGNTYNLDTSHIGKQEITINKYGNGKNYTYSQNKINSITIKILFVIEVEGDKNKIISFQDENLNRVILEKYDIDNDEKITENDVINLTRIDISNENIISLQGIEQASNLRYVEAYSNKIRDISPLMQLENLTFVELYGNEITDITCLKNRKFKHVYAIGYDGNYIDFSNNSENTRTYLEEWQKDIEKYGNADYYGSGKELLCSFASNQKYGNPDDKNLYVDMDNKIKQAIIEQLSADTNGDGNLTREEMYNVPNYNSSTHQQNTLNLSNLNLTNLSGLEYLTNISSIDISNNQISDIKPLEHLFNLTDLNASNNNIDNIDELPYYKNNGSTKYNFSNNKITDISCLENWVGCYSTVYVGWRSGGDPNLRTNEFDFSNNNIDNINGIKNLKCLMYMNLNNNKITDISSLKDYNFEVNTEIYDGEEYLKEQLEDFKGIYLRENNIDPDNNGNRAAIEVFKNKGVKLALDSDFEGITLIDDRTNIQITTIGEDTAEIQVQQIQQESTEYQEISEQLKEMEIISAVDISIVNGEYEGKIVVTIPVKEELNGKYVKVLHQRKNGQTEEFIRKVKDASVSVEVTDLSPFYIAYNENKQEYKKGDVNDDGKINVRDLEMLYECVSEAITLSSAESQRADVNDDGKVNVKDLNRLYEHVSEINPLDE